jgi:hypothetical protein
MPLASTRAYRGEPPSRLCGMFSADRLACRSQDNPSPGPTVGINPTTRLNTSYLSNVAHFGKFFTRSRQRERRILVLHFQRNLPSAICRQAQPAEILLRAYCESLAAIGEVEKFERWGRRAFKGEVLVAFRDASPDAVNHVPQAQTDHEEDVSHDRARESFRLKL